MNEERVARGLGWFSMALGLAEVAAAPELGRFLGLEHRTDVLRLFGLREMISGVGILSSQRPRGWMWGRVAGDAMDLVLLASVCDDDNPQRDNALAALGAVAGVTVADIWCAWRLCQRTYLHTGAPSGGRPAGSSMPVSGASHS